MGEVSGSESVTINADYDTVLAAVLDIEGSVAWFPGLISAEVTEADADGRPLSAHQVNDMKVAKDSFDLVYTNNDNGLSWELAAPSSAQKANTGSWEVEDLGGSAKATLTLRVDPSLPLPGFVVKKVLKDTLSNATKGLKKYCEN